MATWKRDWKFAGLVKTANLRDGEMISLLLGRSDSTSNELLAQIYPAFVDLDQTRDKAIGIIFLASALALLSYFEIVKSFSTSGFEISANYLKHISLWAGAISGMYFAMLDSKHMFYKCLFEHIFRAAEPAKRSLFLLLYPRAFDPVKYAESSIGFPRDIHPKRYRLFMPFAVLALLALAIVILASLAMYTALALDVWNSKSVSPIVSKVTVIGTAFVTLLSMLFPKHYDFPRTYYHYGLSNLFTRLNERDAERASHFHRLLSEIKIRLGLKGID